MAEPTTAEIEAGARAHAITHHSSLRVTNSDRDCAVSVLRAVLSDHGARVRAEVAEKVVAALIGDETKPHGMISVAEAVEIAREVAGTLPEAASSGPDAASSPPDAPSSEAVAPNQLLTEVDIRATLTGEDTTDER